MSIYPMLNINLELLRSNTARILSHCESHGIKLCGVVKGFGGISELVEQLILGGCRQIGSSRTPQLKTIKELWNSVETLLLRIPMLSEIEEVVKYCDISLNSEIETLIKLDEAAARCNKIHKVVVMYDLGDLREGIIKRDQLIELCLFTENELSNIYLSGIATNLGCYGAIVPTEENLGELSLTAKMIEKRINRKLDIVSGGGSTSLPLIARGQMPSGINHLRIGGGMINPVGMIRNGIMNVKNMNCDTFIIKAQIVELNVKPTYPIGQIFTNAFGEMPHFVDKGNRKRAILALGNQDVGDCNKLVPKDESIKVIGASSDHLIIDIQDCRREYRIGDIVEFNTLYQAMLFACLSQYVKKVFLK